MQTKNKHILIPSHFAMTAEAFLSESHSTKRTVDLFQMITYCTSSNLQQLKQRSDWAPSFKRKDWSRKCL